MFCPVVRAPTITQVQCAAQVGVFQLTVSGCTIAGGTASGTRSSTSGKTVIRHTSSHFGRPEGQPQATAGLSVSLKREMMKAATDSLPLVTEPTRASKGLEAT